LLFGDGKRRVFQSRRIRLMLLALDVIERACVGSGSQAIVGAVNVRGLLPSSLNDPANALQNDGMHSVG
jgi:hypothetical protein